MGFFDDYHAAVEAYPRANMALEIRDVDYPGSSLNVSERGTFGVLVRNDGLLRVSDVVLRVRGLDGVRVKDGGAHSQFTPEIELSSPESIVVEPAGGSFLIGVDSGADWHQQLSFETPATPRLREQDLIEVSIMNWAVDLAPIHVAHGWTAAATTYVDRVQAAFASA